MKLIVPNFGKYNPRGDVKHPTWFRLENDFVLDEELFGASVLTKLVWVYILGLRNKHGDGPFLVNEEKAAVIMPCDVNDFLCSVEWLERHGFVTVAERIRSDPDGHGRVRSDPSAHDRTRTDPIPARAGGRTDGTGRDGTDGRTVPAAPRAGAGARAQVNDPPPMPPHPAEFPTAAPPAPDPGPTTPATIGRAQRPAMHAEKDNGVQTAEPGTDGSRVWSAYCLAYTAVYGHAPARNGKQNALCKQLVQRLGVEDAERVVRFYLTHRKAYYTSKTHALDACVADCEGLRTQMLAGHRITQADARRVDDGQTNEQTFATVRAQLKAEGRL